MEKKISVAVIGCGSRGCRTYGNLFYKSGLYDIVSLCDIDPKKLELFGEKYGVKKENLFLDEKEFFKCKRADALILATQDRDHVRQALQAIKLGYDILLEKPISPVKEELLQLLDATKNSTSKIMVCHVLRYAPGFVKIKELLDMGVIGKLIRVETIEQVAFWHQAHSFVRGNWQNDQDTSPMIMQKCCHDLDLIQYYVGAKCEKVYSVGDLSFFRKENQPQGASDRCFDCKYKNSCIYSAENLYVERFKKAGCPQCWPYNVVDISVPMTEESLRNAYKNNGYGQCVFACKNNVVDNQMVDMYFENGVKVTHVMTAFTSGSGRKMTFHGTIGEISLHDEKDEIRISVYGKEDKFIKISELCENDEDKNMGHGGGDAGIYRAFTNLITGKSDKVETSIEASIESHLIAICAEESRKTGKIVKIR